MMSLILVLVASTANPDPGPREPARVQQVCSVRALGGPVGVTVSRGVPFYSATRILSVRFRAQARLRPSRGRGSAAEGATPSLRLEVYAPNGDLYDVLDASSEDARGRSRLIRAEARLPVAGSSIIHSSLYGRWRVVPFIEGDEAPCGRTRTFSIQP